MILVVNLVDIIFNLSFVDLIVMGSFENDLAT